MTVFEKIKKSLTPEDLKVFEATVQKLVDQKVLKESAKVSTSIKKKQEAKFESRVADAVLAEKSKLVESYDVKMSDFKEKVGSKLSEFLDNVIVEQISDDMLEKVAMNEVYSPIVSGIKKVFVESGVDFSKAINEQKTEKNTETETELSDTIAENVELKTKLNKATSYLLISEKTKGLTESMRKKTFTAFKDEPSAKIENKIDGFIGLLKESTRKVRKAAPTVDTPDLIVENKKSKPPVPKAKDSSMANSADRFM